MKGRIFWLLVTILVLAGVPVFLIGTGCQSSGQAGDQQTAVSEMSGKDLYRQALENALANDSKNVSGSFNIDSESTKIKGEFTGSASGKNGRIRAEADISGAMKGIPVSMVMEIIAIEDQGTSDGYANIKSVTSSDSKYKLKIEALFAPALGKWMKLADKDHKHKPASFEKEGAVAITGLFSAFDPLVTLNESDQKLFLSSIDKNSLYQVGNTVDNTQFNGVDARKVRVTINKEAFVNVDKEVSASVSKDSDWEASDSKYTDQVFGKNKTLTADVYLDPNSPGIVGVSLVVNFDFPIEETAFNTTLTKVAATLVINYDSQITINPPDKFYSEKEIDAMMGQ